MFGLSLLIFSMASLIDVLNRDDELNCEESPDVIRPSPYTDITSATEILSCRQNTFTILSINCQSLHAKFNELVAYLELYLEYSSQFSVICIQESWLTEQSDLLLLRINGYTLIINENPCSIHGGTAIYIRDTYEFTVLSMERNLGIWDGLFLEIITDNSLNAKKNHTWQYL